jgi:hypothetical protein
VNIYDLSVNQLKRAAVIKEQIERLNKELSAILAELARSRAGPRTESKMGEPSTSQTSDVFSQTYCKAKNKTMSQAAMTKLSAKLKAYRAQKKCRKK